MKTKRIAALLSFLDKDDRIIDIGCDHAYVCILMAKMGAQKILGIDIHKGALEMAWKNVLTHHLEDVIELSLGDGLSLVDPLSYNTLVMAGMGYTTIKHILRDKNKLVSIEKIVLQSNTDLALLRAFMQTLGYRLEDEKIIYEKKHYYTVMKYQKGRQSLTEEEREFGLRNPQHREYYLFLDQTYEKLLEKIPKNDLGYQEIEKKRFLLQKYL